MSAENVAVVAAMYAAFARGDINAVLADVDTHVEWRVAENFVYADGNPYIGRDAVRYGVFGRVPEDWDRYDVHLEEYVDGGETVVSRGRYITRHRRTGRVVDAQFAHVVKLRAGKIVFFQQYTDTAQFRDASS